MASNDKADVARAGASGAGKAAGARAGDGPRKGLRNAADSKGKGASIPNNPADAPTTGPSTRGGAPGETASMPTRSTPAVPPARTERRAATATLSSPLTTGDRFATDPAGAARAVAGAAPTAPKAKRKKPRRAWTAARQAAFLQHLAQTANVAASCRAAGMKDATGALYLLRQKSAEFRASWAVALREGYAALELALLDRALNGTPTPIIHGGELKGTAMHYSERLAMFLINAHRDTVARIDAHDRAAAAAGDVQALLAERLTEMRARIDADDSGDMIETKAMPPVTGDDTAALFAAMRAAIGTGERAVADSDDAAMPGLAEGVA